MSLLERFLSSKIERTSASFVRIPGRNVSERNVPLILTRVNFKGTKVSVYFLVDTGAAVSLIMPRDQSRLGIAFDEKQAICNIGFFNDNECIMRCETQELALTLSGFTLDQQRSGRKPLILIRTMVNFYIPDPRQTITNHPSILGRDVLSLFNLTYDRDFVALETGENPDSKLKAYRIRGRYFK